ncbi:polyprotein [Rhynchospora pubera]|uniref:RNA-directed DNA polymerase n=1 Tax=Rhynchospora pubera TaxID=906938 RepID=A0AAV8FLJ9_9POAL|nr:polyprotein [Rhynchospora pubera]
MSRTQTTTEAARPSVSERDTNQTPTVEDQIRGYHLGSRLRFEAQRRLPGQSRRYQRSLESQMNPDAELNISQYRRAQQVPAETLYQAGWSESRHRVYQHYSDERTLVTDGQQVELSFISEESFNRLLQEGLQHLHIGLIMVRLYTLHRRSAGVNALVLIRDTRWRDDRAVISSMEMDLTSGTQLAYTAPDMTLSIRDFRDHIQLVIQTHGYEGWQGGESNLLLSRSLIGRLSNTSHTNFRYNVQNVANHLASRGVRAIPGSQRTTTELRGRQWLVRPAVISQAQNPQVARIRARTDGSLSVRFAGYTTTPEQEAIRGENDEEELEQEFINLLTLDDDWPYEDDPEFPEIYSDPEEFSENDETEQDDGPLLGKWFLAILKAEQTEPTVEMMEPIYPYQWFAIEQLDNEDELVQMTFAEFNWLETVDAESEWFEEQALMMTCQWDESDEDEILSTVQFLSQLGAPANQDEDLLSLLAKGGGEDVSSPNSKTKWDEDLFETVYMIEEMEYPQFKNLKKKVETVLSTAESSLTRIPPEPIMGPAMYPPGSRQPQNLQIPEIKARLDNIRGGYARQMNERFNLPTAQASQGAILVLPEDIGLYSEVISRWESITLNLVNEKNWADNKSKVNYIENLLGETEKKTWIQWRMGFPTEYEELVNIADDPQNVISQIRRMFLLEDPTTGSTEEQDRAYNDLERLSCHNVKDLFDYINDYKILAAKSGRMFISPELSTKFFRKMSPIIGGEIEKAFAEKYPGNTVGVIPRIHFTYQYLAEQCKRVALQRSLKDLSFCSRIPVPGYYQKNKKYGLRKAKTYRGKPHDTHIRVFKRKHADKVRKCKCFICGEEGHFARNYTRQKGNIARAAIVENLDLNDDWDVLSVDQNEPDSDAICSFSEGGGTSHSLMAGINEVPYETAMMITSEEISWRVVTSVPQEIQNCAHQWEDNSPVAQEFMRCLFCKEQTNPRMGAHCSLCHLTVCPMCSRFNLGRRLTIQKSNLQYDNKDTLINELIGYTNFLLAENQRLKERIEELEMGKDLDEMRDPTKGKTPEKQILEEVDSDDEAIENHIQKRNGVLIKMLTDRDEYINTQVPDPRKGKRVLNRLYNIELTMEIPGVENFKIQAILDTGATVCCVDQNAVPKEALEPSAYPIQINGVNSSQIANQKLKGGMMAIEENRFRIPFTYAFPMEQRDGIQMLIGCNFIRAMQGGLRIEGQMVTFYKNVTTIATKVDAEVAASAAIEELELSELEYFEIQRITAYSCGEESQKFKERFRPLLERLREQGYIGENPLQHWEKNRVKCKLDIINPDITIQDKPLKHVTPAMKEQFDKHVQALLKIGVIRPSKSRHRTMAMMVNSGTSIDPKTGAEIKGKERMVFNYRTLNDNTHKDQYSLPGINTILKKVGNSRIYSKFDLKSGFHQVAMDPESVEWTAFVVPNGLYEWLVMPFGLKNAPAIFQRKMDDCFRGTENFIAVYIDDILVFSEDEEKHAKHLEAMLTICEKWGLVLSPTKMKIAVQEIEFLSAVIGNKKIKLQPHIIKKIISFDEEKLKEKAGMRSWLGILNYARSYIPKLGTLLGPLYSKTSEHGDKRLKSSDYEIIRKVKQAVQQLPDLELPPEGSYIILETDGCMEGWGGVCKWKKAKHDPRNTEKVCAYASGKFPVIKSTIDAEIYACMETMKALKIHYLDQKEITLRTDCQAIISFYNKSAQNKPSRVRWINFVDFVTGTGVQVNFEHIDGKMNVLADSLSRLTANMVKTGNCYFADEQLADLEKVLEETKGAPEEIIKHLATIIGHIDNMLDEKPFFQNL